MKFSSLVKVVLVPMLAASFLTACGQGDERLVEKAGLEAQKTIDEENRNWHQRAAEMEQDLEIRFRFYAALKGELRGDLTQGDEAYKIKFNFVPSIPLYRDTSRVRRLEEISNDLINLSFNIQVVQWIEGDTSSATGCRFEAVKPDLVNGMVYLSSSECPNFYSIALLDENYKGGSQKPGDNYKYATKAGAKNLSGKVLSKQTNQVNRLVGEMHPTNSADVFNVEVRRGK